MMVTSLKNRYRWGFRALVCFLLLSAAVKPACSENTVPVSSAALSNPFSAKFESGLNLYREARWLEAAAEFRGAQETAQNNGEWTEALYWVILTELAASDFSSALQDMDELERGSPRSGRTRDILYHRGRAYYYLGYFEEAISFFTAYANHSGPGAESRKAAALYWVGECLYSLGQLDQAQDMFSLIVLQYPHSAKYEASAYRLDLIKQKKVEAELLTLLKWSHEESLKTIEEYQRREKTYDQALNAYQKRIADILKDTRLSDLETANAEYRQQLAEAGERIRLLEERLAAQTPSDPPDELKTRARQLRNEMEWDLNSLESNGGSP